MMLSVLTALVDNDTMPNKDKAKVLLRTMSTFPPGDGATQMYGLAAIAFALLAITDA